MAASLSSTFTGRVAAVNAKGVRLDGHETWFNVSKYALGVVLPSRGEQVSVIVDPQGFIRAIETLNAPPAAPAPNGARNGSAARDRTITRLAVLKAAAEFSASKPEALSSDVLKIAASWERWVLREEELLELVDAF